MDRKRLGGGVLAVVAAIGGPLFQMTLPSPSALQIYMLWGVVALLVAVGLYLLFWARDKAEASSPVGDTYNNHGNNFGHIGPVNNFGNQRLVFSEELGRQLLAHLPERRPIELMSVGSQADQKIADQVQQFLTDNGYSVSRMAIGVMAPPPDHKISVSPSGSTYVVTVAPSA